MFIKTKRSILELLNTTLDMMKELFIIDDIEGAILECLEAVKVIKEQLLKEEDKLSNTLYQISNLYNLFIDFIEERTVVCEQEIADVIIQIGLIKSIFQDEAHTQLNVLFLPYKASMWDSLESIYEEAMKDKNCIAKVVPVPYYQLGGDVETPAYEGELFPVNVPIIHYNSYNFKEELPDVIYVHNIYDQYNKVTRVHEFFFTENLKKYTNMLVYVPYHISEPHKSEGEEFRAAYYLPGIKNVDKVVLPGKFIEEEALKDGIPSNKILTLGSPKFDSMIRSLASVEEYPLEWKTLMEGKKVILLATGCNFFCNGVFCNMDLFNLIFDIPHYIEKFVLLWRPHPLTLQTTKRFRPENVETLEATYELFRTGKEKYQYWENFILDESPNYIPALKIADILITEGGSLMQSFLLTEKSVMLLNAKEDIRESFLLPSDAFYYFFDPKQPWYKLFKKFAEGYDPLKEKRKNLAAIVYENVDGTCGEKVYNEIKRCVLELESEI
ncbi:MAG: hypothetical protein ACYDEX_11380 [Mobilitalea sp.]